MIDLDSSSKSKGQMMDGLLKQTIDYVFILRFSKNSLTLV